MARKDALPPKRAGYVGEDQVTWKAEWFDGESRQFVRGRDFPEVVSPEDFRNRAIAAADRRGQRVATRVRGDSVWLQVKDPMTDEQFENLVLARLRAANGGKKNTEGEVRAARFAIAEARQHYGKR